jgi:hypothetical protein
MPVATNKNAESIDLPMQFRFLRIFVCKICAKSSRDRFGHLVQALDLSAQIEML